MVKPKQLLALELKITDALIFQVWDISAFLENNANRFLYAYKVHSLSLSVISISILH